MNERFDILFGHLLISFMLCSSYNIRQLTGRLFGPVQLPSWEHVFFTQYVHLCPMSRADPLFCLNSGEFILQVHHAGRTKRIDFAFRH
jgi:hypothetical protein